MFEGCRYKEQNVALFGVGLGQLLLLQWLQSAAPSMQGKPERGLAATKQKHCHAHTFKENVRLHVQSNTT